ncbi:MAG: hypothetical protein M3Q58_12645 [Bacteroidota bacterium]|nr:hypothetical protein [Bacteroidota bacterium]
MKIKVFYYYSFLTLIIIVGASFTIQRSLNKLSVTMEVKTLHKGESMVAKGTVYYKPAGGLLVSHFTHPSENISITNANGEYKIYDYQSNEVTQAQGQEYSSKNSIFYSFLSGRSRDMGLNALGYKLKETKFEDKLVITVWQPPVNLESSISKVEIVQEDHKPIYMGFFNAHGIPVQKIYYSKFTTISGFNFPLSITEFQYLETGDSIISKRVYSDVRVNEQVEDKYLDFKVPMGAKLILK